MKRQVCVILAIGALVWASAASAQRGNDRRGKKRAKKRGTHFIGELSTGAVFGTGFSEEPLGFGLRSSVGVGGAFKGFPPRFYLVAAFRYSLLLSTHESGTLSSELRRDLVDLSLGLRVLIPFRRLRILVEGGLGDSILMSSATLNEREEFDTSEHRFTGYVATGLQYRLHRNISLGLLLEWAIPTSRNNVDFVGDVSGIKDSGGMQGWTSISATVVGHF